MFLARPIYYIELFLLYILSKTTKTYKNLEFGDFNLQLFRLLVSPNPNILEIGSHDGSTTKKFLELFPTANILCYEPNLEINKKFLSNNFPNNVTLVQKAVGAESGIANLYLSQNSVGETGASSSLSKPFLHSYVHPEIKFVGKQKIEVEDLNSIILNKKIDLMWMDIQGLEYEVLSKSNLQLLDNIEYIYLEHNIFKLYKKSRSLKAISRTLPNHYLYSVNQNDALFCKKSI